MAAARAPGATSPTERFRAVAIRKASTNTAALTSTEAISTTILSSGPKDPTLLAPSADSTVVPTMARPAVPNRRRLRPRP